MAQRAYLSFVSFLLLFAIFCLGAGQACAQGWTKLHTFDGYICLAKFLDANTGFVGIGLSPGSPLSGPVELYKTTDGGTTWIKASIPSGYGGEIGDLLMVDPLNGWIAMASWRASGNKALWHTTDGGLTWNETQVIGSGTSVRITPSAMIVTDVVNSGHISTNGGATFYNGFASGANCADFVDPRHGVTSNYGGQDWLYTSDGGLTWQDLSMNVEAWSVYGDSGTSNFYAAPEGSPNAHFNPGTIYHSTDYGITWSTLASFPFIFTGHLTGFGEQYLFFQVMDVRNTIGGVTYSGFYYSTDKGVTWTGIGGPNALNDTRFSVLMGCSGVNLYGFDDQANGSLFRYSFGSGGSGLSTLSLPEISQLTQSSCVPMDTIVSLNISGCISSSATLDSLWLSGSSAFTISDARKAPRTLAASDSILLRYAGMIGSDSARLHIRYNLGAGVLDTSVTIIGTRDSQLITRLSLPATPAIIQPSSCEGTSAVILLRIAGCIPSSATLDSLWLVGSPSFNISDPRKSPRSLSASDSTLIRYTGTHGPDTAQLHIRYNLGSGEQDTTIQLIGTVSSPFLTQPTQLHREAASAYFGQIDSLTLGVDIASQINLDSLWPYISDIQASYTWDTSVASYGGYLSPSGWSATSLASHGNSVDIDIQNQASSPTQPINLGIALFRPRTTQLATTWVELASFVIDAGGQALSLCVTDNEDNHWAVKTLGVQSGVMEVPVPEQDISIYPNPADDELFVQNPNELPVSITLYDEIGREVMTASAMPASTSSISIESLPTGTYFLVCHTAGRIETKCITKQ